MFRTALAAALLSAVPALSHAQPMPAPHPAVRTELRQDRRELARAEELLARWDAASARRDRRALRAVEDDVLRTLDRAVREARAEADRSRADALDGRGWQRGDERRELRDDRRDLARLSALRADFAALRGRQDRRALDRKHALLEDLVQVARGELREDRPERPEARRELHAYGR